MKKVMLLLFALAVIASCEKDETPETPTNQESISDYFPLAVGNYWVYLNYSLSVDGVRTNHNSQIDSVIVTKDTLIDGVKHFVLERTMLDNELYINWQRTLKYYISETEDYSSIDSRNWPQLYTNFTDTLFQKAELYDKQDTIVNSSWKMEKSIEKITVPVGTFEVIDFKGTHYSYSKRGIEGPRHSHIYYAKNIGIIKEVIVYAYYLSPSLEKELIRYHINK